MIFNVVPSGSYGRWAVGAIILVYLIAYNETGPTTTLCSTFIAAVCAIFSAFCKSSLNHLQLPYLRATHKTDFLILFLAIWVDILTLICACGALARTLSVCLDTMTGGMARIYILGRNAPVNEPWPDVIGFSIVFVVSIMFMLGLENSNIFSGILIVSVTGVTALLVAISWMRGSVDTLTTQKWFTDGYNGVLKSAALMVFAYPSEVPETVTFKRIVGASVVIFVSLTNTLIAYCLSTVLKFSPPEEFIAVPILSILEITDFHKIEPAIACFLFLASSSAFLELFSEMFYLIVKLTTSDWKILSRQIGYEHGDSGSPVLAVFSGGSICAMIAFACPMEIIIYLIAGSQLCSALLRSFYLFYSPFRPKYMMNSQNDTSLAYSRLNTVQTEPPKATAGSSSSSVIGSAANIPRRIFRCLSKPKIMPLPKSKSRCSKKDEELEREWLLLGEPQSPRNTVIIDNEQDTSSLSVVIPMPSGSVSGARDAENIIIGSNSSDSDSATDIDAIVDEYRQKVKVTTAGPSEKIVRIPSLESWRLSMVCVALTCIGTVITIFGTINSSNIIIISGLSIVILLNLIMIFLPRYQHTKTSPSSMFCSLAILLESVLFGATLSFSWPAIIAWIIAGILIFTRCDTWFSICIEQPIYINQTITPTTSGNVASIRVSRPPKGDIITARLRGQCR